MVLEPTSAEPVPTHEPAGIPSPDTGCRGVPPSRPAEPSTYGLSTGPLQSSTQDVHSWVMNLHDIAIDGLVTTAQARAIGLGPADLRALRASGEIRRLIRGWYAVRTPDAIRAPWEGEDSFASARALHRLTTIALLGSFEGRVCASHQSALVLHDIAMWRSDLAMVHVARTTDDHTRHRTGAVIHPACGLDPVRDTLDKAVPHHLTVPPAVAVVQVGLRPFRGGKAFPLESLVAADSALHQGLLTRDDLTAAVVLHEGHPGIRAVREFLVHADGRHESVGETRLGVALRLLGYETEPQQHRTVGSTTYRVDQRIKGTRVVVEFDGIVKYLPETPTEDDLSQARRALVAEKTRQDRLVEDGDEFVRVRWSQLDGLQELGRRIEGAIARSGGRLSA